MIPQRLKEMPVWCVSKDKVPKDMYALARGLDWGVSTRRSHCCYVGYGEAAEVAKKTGLPVTMWVDAASQAAYVIDVEKTCPAEIRRAILLSLHDDIRHIETSLSGKGFHFLVELPQPADIRTAKYKKWLEVLTAHHCTFTGRELDFGQAYAMEVSENQALEAPGTAGGDRDAALMDAMSRPMKAMDFYEAIGGGASVQAAASQDLGSYKAALSTFDGRHADMFNIMCDMVYAKTVDGDFHGDWSSWEFGYASKLHYLLARLSADMIDADMSHYELPLTKEQAVMLVYMVLKQMLPPRDKHSEARNGLPWLLYTSERVYSKTFG